MAHENLTVWNVLDLVRARRPAVSDHHVVGDQELRFQVYEAFTVAARFDDYGRGSWGFAVEIGNGTGGSVSSVLGTRLTLCDSEQRVSDALDAIDRYARLRLGAEYLEAYAAAHPS